MRGTAGGTGERGIARPSYLPRKELTVNEPHEPFRAQWMLAAGRGRGPSGKARTGDQRWVSTLTCIVVACLA